MNLFKSKHQKLLDEKEKIQTLYKKVSSIKPVSEIDEEVKTTQLATLVNNWVTLAKLLDEYQPQFVETDPTTFRNMIGGKRRTPGLYREPHSLLKAECPAIDIKQDFYTSRYLNTLPALIGWETVLPNLKEKAKFKLGELVENKKLTAIKNYCKTYGENSQIFEDFILAEPRVNINSRLKFIHINFYSLRYLYTELTHIGDKRNIIINISTSNIHVSEVIVLCDKLQTYYYDFLIRDMD